MHGRRFGSTLIPLGLATALVACGSRVPEAGESSSTAAAATTGDDEPPNTTAPTPGTTTGPTGPTDPTEPSSSSTDAETDDPDCKFPCSGDVGSAWPECDIWEQDCPAGEKCTPWANDGGNSWNATRCVPVAPDPDEAGAPCTAEGSGTTGIDSCELGAMCWGIDPETNQGTCTSLCVGNPSDPMCPEPDHTCTLSGAGILNLCVPLCDPLDPAICPENEGCYPFDDSFICIPDASGPGGGTFEPCEYSNACSPGRICADPQAVGQCDGAPAGCCTPVCDLQAPSCPAPTACVPWFPEGVAPPQYDDVGACLLEE